MKNPKYKEKEVSKWKANREIAIVPQQQLMKMQTELVTLVSVSPPLQIFVNGLLNVILSPPIGRFFYCVFVRISIVRTDSNEVTTKKKSTASAEAK